MKRMQLVLYAVVVVSTALIAACSAVSTNPPTRSQTTILPQDTQSLLSGASKIYVSNSGNNTVTTYTVNGLRTTPTITAGLNVPSAIAVDTGGKIYVTNAGNNTMTAYTASGTRTTPTITGLNNPQGVAVDAHGTIYVENNGDGTLRTYTPSGTRVSPTITVSSFTGGVAADAFGRLFLPQTPPLGYGLGHIRIFYAATGKPAPGDGSISAFCLCHKPFRGIAVDAVKLYVATANRNNPPCACALKSYTLHGINSTAPTINFGIPPGSVAVDATGKIYVAIFDALHIFTTNGDPLPQRLRRV